MRRDQESRPLEHEYRTRSQGVLMTTPGRTAYDALVEPARRRRQCSMTCRAASSLAVSLSGPGCGTKTASR